uniref:Homeobox domain-containing protein n=1 Tax=Bionectria ochroleuca TaxID=29856 RepID=A0A8H7NGY5_BIOOC
MSGSRYNHRGRSGSLSRSPNRDAGEADIQALTQEPPDVSPPVFLLDNDPSLFPLSASRMHSSSEGTGPGLISEDSIPFPASLGQDWMSGDNEQFVNNNPLQALASSPVLPASFTATTFIKECQPSIRFRTPAAKIIAKPPPKIGTRFSRDSTKFLNRWLSNHENHPYPSREDIKILQLQTGLNKTQIQNWLANTRRRQKKKGGSTSQSRYVYPRSTSDPLDAPLRPGTPAIRNDNNFRDMNPLQRWVESPPDREPATVKDIARAVASSPPRPSDTNDEGQLEDSLAPSVNDSSASSRGTSSGSSLGSAHSHSSGSSFGGLAPFARKRRRSKRARVKAKADSLAPIRQQLYQCTFCTETFLTKHDWQRHEKSLHIPLERWECSPNGPRERNPTTGKTHCGFCGELDPSDSHIESHQPGSCQERAFNRKDYLRQHLQLVHKSALIRWVADIWKTPTPEVRSRCGFCGENLNTWDERVEHLAEHFKLGLTMAEWTGDWGFDDVIVHTLENSIPPYLIHNERTSPYPFEASNQSPESPRSAYELLTVELSYFVGNYQFQHRKPPDNATMVVEACRIIFASEILSVDEEPGSYPSWLRDLIMSDHNLAFQARVMPIRTPSEGRLRTLQLRGKRNLFEDCPLDLNYEASSQTFTTADTQISLTLSFEMRHATS